MNAIGFVPLPAPEGDTLYSAACAMFADGKIIDAMNRISGNIAAIYEPRRALMRGEATAASELRVVLNDLASARALLAPLTVERG